MNKVLKILKINLFSLPGILLFLLAACFKLLAKAMEKIVVFLSLGALALLTSCIINTIARNPDQLAKQILHSFGMILLFSIVIGILRWIFSLASSIILTLWNFLISVFDGLYDLTYSAYLYLYTACETDYKILSLNGRKIPNALLCLFYSILRGLSWLIVTLVSVSLPAAITLSVLLVLGSLWGLNRSASANFGMNFFRFLWKFNAASIISGILIYIIFIGVAIIAVMALASEWYEWAQELKMTGQEISGEISGLIDSKLQIASGTAEEVEKNQTYLNTLQNHVDGLDGLGQQVSKILEQKDNAMLRSYWGTYMRNLSPLVEECSGKKGLTSDQFRRLIPQIRLLDQQRENVKKLADKLTEELLNPSGSSTFFAGCDTLDKLEKRYKSLCKAYHPDMVEGDTSTFQKMKLEYESLKSVLSAETEKK